MNTTIELAQDAVKLLFPDSVDLKRDLTNKTKGEKFIANRQGKPGQITISIAPEGDKATFEWRGYLNKNASYFRIFRVVNFPLTLDQPTPAAPL